MSAIEIKDMIKNDIRGIVIKGILLRKYEIPEDLSLLDQDILEIELPNGINIDVGWFPENDPNGAFVIRVYRQDIRRPLRSPIQTRNSLEVARWVASIVQDYAEPIPYRPMPISCSGTTTVRYDMIPLGRPSLQVA
jgi:hypothetical protein